MTNHTTQPKSEQPSTVEKQWVEIFDAHGVSPQQADLLTKTVFGVSQISKSSPSSDEIRSIVERKLEEVDFEDHLEQPSDRDAVREELLDTLDSALNGVYVGPLTAPESIAFNTKGVAPPPTGTAASTNARPDKGLGAVEPDSDTPDAEEVAEIRAFLSELIEEQDLNVGAVKKAAASLEYPTTDTTDDE